VCVCVQLFGWNLIKVRKVGTDCLITNVEIWTKSYALRCFISIVQTYTGVNVKEFYLLLNSIALLSPHKKATIDSFVYGSDMSKTPLEIFCRHKHIQTCTLNLSLKFSNKNKVHNFEVLFTA